MRQEFFSIKALTMVLVLFGIGYIPQAFAIQETEPNNECTSAQDLGTVALPLTIDGTINVDEVNIRDDDYFKITTTPGDTIAIEYNEPAFAVPFFTYDSSCNQIQGSQDFGSFRGRVRLTVPGDGIVILSVNYSSNSPAIYPYQITVSHYDPYIGTISGRVINADTGAPWQEGTNVNLCRIEGDTCNQTSQTILDSQGNFSFTGPITNPPGEGSETSSNPPPVESGTFSIEISARVKDGTTNTISFTVAANENKDLGEIRLQPFVFITIRSISGRVVDAVSGTPLPGNAEPFARVFLYRCDSLGSVSCSLVNSRLADSEGRFRFTENNRFGSVNPLEAGLYSIGVAANQYSPLVAGTTVFEVNTPDENRDVGDVRVQPLPVKFSNKVPCTTVSAQRGKCEYTVTITNGLATAFSGETWSIVNATGTGSPSNSTSFQTGSPSRLTLKPGGSRTVKFSFRLPNTISNNANICADVYVGKRPNAASNIVGQTNVFCLTKSAIGLSLKLEKEAFELSNQLNGKEAVVSQPAYK